MTRLQNSHDTTAEAKASQGSRLVAQDGAELPLKGVTITGVAGGGIARVRLQQHFSNPFPEPLDLVYLLPLPADGVVSAYEVRAGARRIVGLVDRREDAETSYETARLEGKTATLLEHERPNVFTQRLGNIPPSTDVVVELTIDHPLAWLSGIGWEWRFPTVVAPRYPGVNGQVPDADAITVDVLDGTAGPTVTVEFTISDQRTVPAASTTHSIAEEADGKVTVTGAATLDRDIAIRWAVPTGDGPVTLQRSRPVTAGDSTEPAYGLLTISPPIRSERHFSRDLVLLLDVSGSMQGTPLGHLKSVVSELIYWSNSTGSDPRGH